MFMDFLAGVFGHFAQCVRRFAYSWHHCAFVDSKICSAVPSVLPPIRPSNRPERTSSPTEHRAKHTTPNPTSPQPPPNEKATRQAPLPGKDENSSKIYGLLDGFVAWFLKGLFFKRFVTDCAAVGHCVRQRPQRFQRNCWENGLAVQNPPIPKNNHDPKFWTVPARSKFWIDGSSGRA